MVIRAVACAIEIDTIMSSNWTSRSVLQLSIRPPNAASDFLQTENKAENKPYLCRHFKFSFLSYLVKDGRRYTMDCHGFPENLILDPGSWFFSFILPSYLDIYALNIWCYMLYPNWFARCWPYNLRPEQPFSNNEFGGQYSKSHWNTIVVKIVCII